MLRLDRALCRLRMGVRMTRAQQLRLIWRHTHRDLKGRINGKGNKYIVFCRADGPHLVELPEITDQEIAQRMPYALRKEAQRRAGK
jgi:hypothetical protein